MDAISYTTARTDLAKTMEQVCEDHSPVIITRSKAVARKRNFLNETHFLRERLGRLTTLAETDKKIPAVSTN